MRAMGATRRSVIHIFVFQGLFIGMTGTGIGLALGLAVSGPAGPVPDHQDTGGCVLHLPVAH